MAFVGRNDLDDMSESDTGDDLRRLICTFQSTPGTLLEDPLCRQRAHGPNHPVLHGGKHALDRIGGPQMDPVLGREVVERQQNLLILEEAISSARLFGTVFLGEGFECKLRGDPARRHRDILQGFLQATLHGARDLVEHVDGLVLPAALPARAEEDFSSAFQKPRAPSPTASSCGFRSMSPGIPR
ncbi:hypothetical protein ACVIHI_000031 [Bradyrhizobium sp. USDA 4524]|nr:hypothetical protein [Bradyrhizobium sp. USDA 4538]MCP1899171.1 hypothetical protein [Bradyrhizobium sp. USDA 4537]MCP1986717.1 hypothetical protein [Bradyrhizobium sp. USDA 4539]